MGRVDPAERIYFENYYNPNQIPIVTSDEGKDLFAFENRSTLIEFVNTLLSNTMVCYSIPSIYICFNLSFSYYYLIDESNTPQLALLRTIFHVIAQFCPNGTRRGTYPLFYQSADSILPSSRYVTPVCFIILLSLSRFVNSGNI